LVDVRFFEAAIGVIAALVIAITFSHEWHADKAKGLGRTLLDIFSGLSISVAVTISLLTCLLAIAAGTGTFFQATGVAACISWLLFFVFLNVLTSDVPGKWAPLETLGGALMIAVVIFITWRFMLELASTIGISPGGLSP
jgi:hypothetical protein